MLQNRYILAQAHTNPCSGRFNIFLGVGRFFNDIKFLSQSFMLSLKDLPYRAESDHTQSSS